MPAVRVRTATGWQDVATQGAVGATGARGDTVRFPSFAATRTGTTTLAMSSANWIPMVFATEDWDTHGWWDPATNRFTPQVAGIYRLTGQVHYTPTLAANTRVLTGILKNGSSIRAAADYVPPNAVDDTRVLITALASANGTTDYFQLAGHQTSGAVFNIGGSVDTYFMGELVEASGGTLTVPQPSVVTVLPTNPTDGQEVYFQVPTTGELWHLRYVAGFSSATNPTSKWFYLGGAAMVATQGVGNNLLRPASAWGSTSTNTSPEVTLTLPLAGMYDVDVSVGQVIPGSAGVSCSTGVGHSGSTDANGPYEPVAVANVATSQAIQARYACTAGQMRLMHNSASAATIWRDRAFRVTPYRVG